MIFKAQFRIYTLFVIFSRYIGLVPLIVTVCSPIKGVQRGQTTLPGPEGVGLEAALPNYALWAVHNYGMSM